MSTRMDGEVVFQGDGVRVCEQEWTSQRADGVRVMVAGAIVDGGNRPDDLLGTLFVQAQPEGTQIDPHLRLLTGPSSLALRGLSLILQQEGVLSPIYMTLHDTRDQGEAVVAEGAGYVPTRPAAGDGNTIWEFRDSEQTD